MKTKFKFVVLLTILLTIILATTSIAQTFSADSNDRRNQASFISDAPFEKIIGVSSGMDAIVTLNIKDITKKPTGKVTVQISNIKTGIALRDEHLTGKNWLDATNFPFAAFQLTEINNPSTNTLINGEKVTAILVGKFTVHGIAKNIEALATLEYFKESDMTKVKATGNLLIVHAELNIKLSDYGVKIPSMVVGKVSEEVKIEINFVASDDSKSSVNQMFQSN